MQSWMFTAMQAIARGEKIDGKQLMGLKELGYISLSQETETWLPTTFCLEETRKINKEFKQGPSTRRLG